VSTASQNATCSSQATSGAHSPTWSQPTPNAPGTDRTPAAAAASRTSHPASAASLEAVTFARVADRSGVSVGTVSELLPLDETRRQEVAVVAALGVRALHDDGLRAVVVDADRALAVRAAAAFTDARACGEAQPDLDAEVAAAQLLVTVDGLATRLLRDEKGVSATWEPALDRLLGALLPGKCAHLREPGGARSLTDRRDRHTAP
jgi:hypothetical protein